MSEGMIVCAAHAGTRLDVFAAAQSKSLSRSAAQKLIEAGHITVNGGPAKARYGLKPGDAVMIDLPPPQDPDVKPEHIPLDILYEDAALIVVNKPKGMVVHPAAGHGSGTLVNALLWHCDGALSGINGVLRPGIVHRIDKDTSGALAAAKTDAAHSALSAQLADRSVIRVYHALLCGNVRADGGTIDKPIGRHPADRKRMAVITDTGKAHRRAVTHYRTLERFDTYTLTEARLETGRTHQIRVHMAHIGHPVAGDPVYGRGLSPLKIQGQALHARFLGFRHPDDGREMLFEAPLPDYFQDILANLRERG